MITSIYFLFVFLPLALCVYHLAAANYKEYILVVLSFVFYGLGCPDYMLLFAGATFATVCIGRMMHRTTDKRMRCLLLIAGIASNLGLLLYYKYSGPVVAAFSNSAQKDTAAIQIVLPLGISFFTFKAVSYLADIYTQKAILSERIVSDMVYLSFFAQIQSGPLARYNDMRQDERCSFDGTLFANGVFRFLIGFSKKILLANMLFHITSEVFALPIDKLPMNLAWLGAICFSLQLYFDFAGYSDMAIGLTEMFGYHCRENFNYPYMTESVTKFWRRWHISLSEWFRDYVYIPLGGSRTKRSELVYFNLLIVWLLTGIWHGASMQFVVWGLGYFAAICFERLMGLPSRIPSKAGKFVYRILTLFYINFLWVLFNSPNLTYGLQFIGRMIAGGGHQALHLRAGILLSEYGIFIAAAILFCFPVVPKCEKIMKRDRIAGAIFDIIEALVVLLAFVLSLSFVVAGQNNPFAYANF